MAVSVTDFRAAMRQLAAAVNVITTEHEGHRAGMTATAVMSLTAEPPLLGVAVNRSNASYATFSRSGVFAVNVLPHDQLDLATTFAGTTGVRGEDRFASGSWGRLQTGAPILLDSVTSFDCSIEQIVQFATHDLMVGRVEAVQTAPVKTPLLYMDGAWASLVRTTNIEFKAYEQIVEGIADVLDAAIASPGCPRAQLHQFSDAFVDLSTDAIEILRDFHSHETFARAERLSRINQRKRDVESKLRALLIRGAEVGDFDIGDAAMTTDAIIGMLNSIHRSPNVRGVGGVDQLKRQFGYLVTAMVAPHRRLSLPPVKDAL
ncbi:MULTISPECIES: flavin reductase [unclassified Bradyrhizobium]|uniref:flavin reductase n=1 Tax=unclassified Bradyrhizobium TaxID=2631580 RepID=UPI0024498F48|nr:MULTISPECIES: flavin reductase [unclassified Bradyrhizobium]MDH2346152.1 flavin reductase [Bradyrhizobium sp. SSUT77]MDH2350474.1 flavin reductase [Bradyrhizobium sp. SSUT112]